MGEVIRWIQEQLAQNEFASGGLIVILGSGLLYIVRNIPVHAWTQFKRVVLLEVEIRQPDPLYDWIGEWVKDVTKKSNRLSAKTARCGDNSRLEIRLIPGIGGHVLRYGGGIFLLCRSREDAVSGGSADSMDQLLQREQYILYGLRSSRKIVMRMLDTVRRSQLEKEGDGPDVYVARSYGEWERLTRAAPRSIQSVIIKERIPELLLTKCRIFLGRRDYYVGRGIPWRMGILLYGPPGNGKTSLITALANELSLAVGILNLTAEGMSDNSLVSLFGNSRGMLIAIEDVDSIYSGRTRKDGAEGVSFSGLLNAIDGIAAGEGRIVVMTTNHKEQLDAALIRRGRIDELVLVGEPDEEQLLRLWELFRPGLNGVDRAEFVSKHVGGSMSNAQSDLLE